MLFVHNHTLGKLLDSDLLMDCKFIRNLRANSMIRANFRSEGQKSVIHSEYKYGKILPINT